MKDLISVIIPVYNRENYLEECIGSVLNQSYKNIEIIIIDDGSSDRSLEIARELSKKDSRIKVFSNNHCGVSAARNTGIDQAKGEFLFFIDSDDIIHTQLLESLVTPLQNSDASIAGSDVVNVSEKYWERVKDKINSLKEPAETSYHNNDDSLNALMGGSSPISMIGGTLMRKDLIGETRFRTDIFIGEDYYFIYENLIKGANTIFLKQRWYFARQHKSNSSWDWSFNGFWTRFYRRKLVWKSEDGFGRTDNAKIQKSAAYGCYVSCLRKNSNNPAEFKKMRQVIREHKKILLSSLSLKYKIHFLFTVYATNIYLVLSGLPIKK